MAKPLAFKRPIFIVGPGRSGTTLLRSVLASHSNITVTPETKFMAWAEEWGLEKGAPENFEEFWAEYSSCLRFRNLGVDAVRCLELIKESGSHSFATIFTAVLAAYGENVGKSRVGEKTPSHFHYLPYLLDWFPDAHILVTQRDPRAILASQLNTYYAQKDLHPRSLRGGVFTDKREQLIIRLSREWVSTFSTGLEPWKGDPRFRTVVYENLVQHPEEEVRAIFNFLGEPFETAVMQQKDGLVPPPAAKNEDIQMEQWRQEHYAKSLQPISSDSLEKWKTQLTTNEVALIEGFCGKTMEALGYQRSVSSRLQWAGRTAGSALITSATIEARIRRGVAQGPGDVRKVVGKMASFGVAKGMPPSWFGYRRVLQETVSDYFKRKGNTDKAGVYEVVHSENVVGNPLPRNLSSREDLPNDQGWWGYSFWDVPRRRSDETFIATVPNAHVVWFEYPHKANNFNPAILNGDGRALIMRELRFRPNHAEALRQSGAPVRLKAAVWIAERSYQNHSHWLTAHLPKLLLLRERGMLGQVLLPPERTAAMDGSLRMLGMAPEEFLTFDMARSLLVEELTVVGTDRFRPELLQLVPQAFEVNMGPKPFKKVFISRLNATRRRLVNEDVIWSLLEPKGFERVLMENLSFAQQVELMRETAVLVAPHGAGLTNMMFCPRGAQIVEIADLGFPNPNFYAVASAMGHDYWLVSAESLGDGHPLDKDMFVEPGAVSDVLAQLKSVSAVKVSETGLNV